MSSLMSAPNLEDNHMSGQFGWNSNFLSPAAQVKNKMNHRKEIEKVPDDGSFKLANKEDIQVTCSKAEPGVTLE